MAGVEINQVVKQFGRVKVLHGIDLSIADSEFVVLVGPSGCGKSTLLRMIAGLEGVSAGQIAIGGQVVNDIPPRGRDIAMVFQDYALYPHKSVFDNMAFGLRMRGKPRAEIDKSVMEAAEILQITHLLERKPGQLSGGQRQRVAMGRAIVRRPKVFLFDEPLSNLDAQLRADMRVEIKKLHLRFGTTIVYVTHDQIEALTLADRIAIMQGGHVQQYGSPDEVYNRPANRFVAGFIGAPPMNMASAQVAPGGQTLVLPGDAEIRLDPEAARRLAPFAGRPVTIGVRPELVSLADGPGANRIAGEVELVEPLGSENQVTVRVGASRFTGRFEPRIRLAFGQAVTIALALERAHMFDADTGATLSN
ncbi:MAG: sn-glycerol-3-phosphate ABC transporter ATP-binding protein UgpC [Rhizobiaceae bacterium]